MAHVDVSGANFTYYRNKAERDYDAYVSVQARITQMERKAALDHNGNTKLAHIALTGGASSVGNIDYQDACKDRARYITMAQLHATMALMYK